MPATSSSGPSKGAAGLASNSDPVVSLALQRFCKVDGVDGMRASVALDQADVQARLEVAAEACGLVKEDGIRAVRRTIASGFRKGLRQPRDLSEIRSKAADR